MNADSNMAIYVTDDRDFEEDERMALCIYPAPNGDWYVSIAPERNKGRGGNSVRLCTSGGSAFSAPGLTIAISKAWESIRNGANQ